MTSDFPPNPPPPSQNPKSHHGIYTMGLTGGQWIYDMGYFSIPLSFPDPSQSNLFLFFFFQLEGKMIKQVTKLSHKVEQLARLERLGCKEKELGSQSWVTEHIISLPGTPPFLSISGKDSKAQPAYFMCSGGRANKVHTRASETEDSWRWLVFIKLR